MSDIDKFLSHCRRDASAMCPLKLAWREFNNSLPAGRRGAWSRDAFLGAMVRAGFSVGEQERRAVVVGLGLPGATWRVTDNRHVEMEVA